MDPLIWLGIGLIMIFLEFFIPGAVMGTIGIIFVIMSLILFAQAATSPLYVIPYIVLVICLIIALIKFALWRIRSTSKENTLYLNTDQAGYTADSYDAAVIGKTGEALTDLRPAGRISIEGNTYQAMTQGGFISRGTEIIVIGGEGPTLIVKSAKKDDLQ